MDPQNKNFYSETTQYDFEAKRVTISFMIGKNYPSLQFPLPLEITQVFNTISPDLFLNAHLKEYSEISLNSSIVRVEFS